MAAPERPPSRPLGPVGRASVVPLEGRPEGRARPLPAAALGRRQVVTAPTAAARRRLRAPVAVGVQGVPPAALQRHETARGVPEVPTRAAPVATMAVTGAPVVMRSAAATPREAMASGTVVVLPALAVTAATAVAAPAPLRGTCLGSGVALLPEEDPIPLPSPRGPVRQATAAAVGAPTSVALAR